MKFRSILSICLLIIISPLSNAAEDIGFGVLTKFKRKEGVSLDGICGKSTQILNLEVGNFEYKSTTENGIVKDFTTNDAYLIEWAWHNNERKYYPIVVDRIEGFSPKIFVRDLNKDGVEEAVLQYVAGAHTHVMKIYAQTGTGSCSQISQIPGTITSDGGEIVILGEHVNGYPVIEALDKNWNDPSKPPKKHRYIWTVNGYR